MPSLRSIAAAAAAAALTAGLSTPAAALTAAPADVRPAALYCGYDNRPTPPSVGPGSTGSAVRELQCLLTQCAYYAGPVNGVFDRATAVALRAFQNDRGIPYDGIVGPQTWIALRNCDVA
ncbi:peptidoglycan-binding domain-containing protein [Streptomyces sp. ADMS]|uniref:peptidoglycan-binding domain-containing protein n=1 Tax=Streptomyces sp. ADMS TaxID=3071415 RepID=UPI00296EB726|nr:peptidoglycan-binding domain-containing protein [Streptomyces sp. ADMS]MDW4908955.1 peptidoglycan-binding domain-containing protein [Streptomyces sp. ADMS]